MSESLALVVVMLAAGLLSARVSLFPPTASETLHRFVIYVCLPALVLSIVPKLRWEAGLWVVPLAPWVMLAVGASSVLLVSRWLSFSRPVQAVLLLCVPLGNTSFLGFPMIEALLGRDALRFAVLYDQLGSFMVLATYGLWVVARYGGDAAPTASGVVLRVIKFPSFIALCLGLAIPHLPASWWPDVAQSIVARVGATLVPVAMFAVGLKMELRAPKPWPAFVAGLGLKMVVLPLCALWMVRVLGVTGTVAKVIVLESGMPAMISAGALAIMAGLAPELAAALVGYGILLSLVTLPWLATLL